MVSKDKLFLVLALVIFVLVAYVIYQYGNALAPKEDGEEEGELSPYSVISLYYEKEVPENYTYVYEENEDGILRTVSLFSDGNSKEVLLETSFYNEKIYYTTNDTILCMELINEKEGNVLACSSVKNESDFSDHLSLMKNIFPSKELLENEKKRMDFLIENGAWTFVEESFVENEVGESKCYNVVYEIDFTKLTIEEAEKMGYSPSQMSFYGDFHREACINEEGEILIDNFTYTFFSKPRFRINSLVDKKEEAEKILVPTELTDIDSLKNLSMKISSLEEKIDSCLVSEDPDNCFKTEGTVSSNLYYCDMAGKERDICVIMIASQENDVGICNKIESIEIKDDCYYDLAIKNSDPSLCDSIINLTKKDFCLGQLITTVDQ